MQIYDELPDALTEESTLTIGVFDGVHRGHQQVIHRAVQRARGSRRLCGVLTFDPHPVEVLAPHVDLRYLTTIPERARLIEALGADFVYLIRFTHAVSQMSARDFVRPLVDRLRMRDLVIGHDFTLGHKRQGDAAFLRALGVEWGFTLEVVPPVMMDGRIVSSTRVREALAGGRIGDALALLGRRHYCLSGSIAADSSLEIDPKRQLPGEGRYQVTARLNDARELDCTAEVAGRRVRLECGAALDGDHVTILFRPAGSAASPDSPSDGYTEIEHTADVALRVRAVNLPDLCREAARGMFSLMTDISQVPSERGFDIDLAGTDRETLLVNWLNELLFQYEMTGLVYCDFDLTVTAAGQLHGQARGGKAPTEIRKHIKAATFNDLRIVERDGMLEVTIVFDI